jgi:hypothetical protein
MARPLIALDADGVLLDFHLGYAGAWARAFGSRPAERDPLAYWPIDRWEVERLDEERRLHFRRHFDEQFWSSVRPSKAPSTPATGSTTPATTWSACRRSTSSTSRRACATCATTAFRSSG